MKYIFTIIITIYSINLFSQGKGVYWIKFNDKNNNTFTISNPSAFLSQRSINRRTNQGIAINNLDLPVSKYYVDSLKNIGFDVIDESKWFNGVIAVVTDTTILQNLSAISFVDSYKKIRPPFFKISNLNKFETPTKADYYNYGMGSTQIQMLKGNELHNLGYKGEGKLIALLDIGYLGTNTSPIFDSLYNNNRIVYKRDFVTGKFDTTVYEAGSHGTSVLSTIGVISSGNLVGTAPHAEFALLRSEDANGEYIFEEYTWVCAAEFADSIGADIISSSLGYTTFDDPTQDHTWSDLDGKTSVASISATIAARKGILVVISAGNSGSQPWHKIGIPADADSILTVGAVNSSEMPSSFTSYGYSADGRVKPDVTAMGSSVAVVDVNGSVVFSNGTSFSCPQIAGLSACLWQSAPNSTNMQIRESIIQSSSKYYSPDSVMGYGIPNFQVANWILTSIANNKDEKEELLSVYPTPFTNEIYFDYFSENCYNIQIEIYDMLGNKVKSENKKILKGFINKISINGLDNIESGLYLLNIITKYNKFSKIIVKL